MANTDEVELRAGTLSKLLSAISAVARGAEALTTTRLPRVLWWITLTAFFSILAFRRRAPLIATPLATFDSVLLAVWLLVLLAPLYSELDLFGLKVKRQVAEVKEKVGEVKEKVAALQTAVQAQAVATSNISFQTPLPPPDPALKDLAEQIRMLANTLAPTTTPPPREFEPSLPPDVSLLVSARLSVEKEIRRLAGLHLPGEEATRLAIFRLTQKLVAVDVIDSRLADAVREVYAVCSAAIHGQTVTEQQAEFVRDAVPGLLRALRSVPKNPRTNWPTSP